jgi:hypothetical protein
MKLRKPLEIKGDKRTKEGASWPVWMDGVNRALERYASAHADEDGTDNPFSYNETASVSVLVAGAALAGFIALADYRTIKLSGSGNDKNGRCDLYLMANWNTWAFEFKQLFTTSSPTSEGRLKSKLEASLKAAKELKGEDHDRAFGGVIIPLSNMKDNATLARARKNIAAFCNAEEKVRYAFHFAEGDNDLETFILFAQSSKI